METNTYCSKGYWDISKKKTEINNVFINENDYIELQNDVKNMKNDIKQIKNTLEELVEMMKFVYDEDT